jgi:hypothetical protein
MFPKELDEEGTKEAGYPVWAPMDRGFCPATPGSFSRPARLDERGNPGG